MEGKIVLVTGSARGIGREIGTRLAKAGATVVLNSRSQAILDEALLSSDHTLSKLDGVAFDVSDELAVQRGLENIIDRHGRLDVLVNNAGVLLDKTIYETELEEWDNVIRNNLTGAFLCSKAAMKHFKERGGGGRIVMIGSVAGQRGAPAGVVAYSASKAGLTGLAQTMAYTAAQIEVTVNVVAPGMIDTEMLRQGFGDRLEEAAGRREVHHRRDFGRKRWSLPPLIGMELVLAGVHRKLLNPKGFEYRSCPPSCHSIKLTNLDSRRNL
jgi:NAD(P)-dependent dehydrogenase (short-subunit alcohol dehydrogenase family)